MNKIVEMPFGSELYGTVTPDSDKDVAGVYVPTFDEVVLNRYGKAIKHTTGNDKSKNTCFDVDSTFYAIQYFFDLAVQGETMAIDMLHCPQDTATLWSYEWAFIHKNRSKFYTKGLASLMGYCKKQAAKYGIKGSRLNDAKLVLDYLKSVNCYRIEDIWESLPLGEHIHKSEAMYQVCGMKIMPRTPIKVCIEMVESYHNKFGARAVLAADNKGIDWKAISHAFRAIHQIKEILSQGDITYPLVNRQYLIDLKLGKFHYINDGIEDKLNGELDLVTVLTSKSNLPKKVDRSFWDDWLVATYKRELIGNAR